MAKVTYIDIGGDAPTVTFHGRSFEDGVSQDVDDTAINQPFLDMASKNSHFDVEGRAKEVQPDPPPEKPEPLEIIDPRVLTGAAPSGFTIPDEGETKEGPKDAYTRGAHAASVGKPKSIPPAYRGKPEGEQWTTGFEDWVNAHAGDEPVRIPSPGAAEA